MSEPFSLAKILATYCTNNVCYLFLQDSSPARKMSHDDRMYAATIATHEVIFFQTIFNAIGIWLTFLVSASMVWWMNRQEERRHRESVDLALYISHLSQHGARDDPDCTLGFFARQPVDVETVAKSLKRRKKPNSPEPVASEKAQANDAVVNIDAAAASSGFDRGSGRSSTRWGPSSRPRQRTSRTSSGQADYQSSGSP